ncbi:MAG: phosphatase PAP2 family protein [Candidatus Altiarchaeota archaeon]
MVSSNSLNQHDNIQCIVLRFPSVHVALSLLVLLYALKFSRKWGYALAPLIVLSWVSTVYLRRHYFIDVIAGIALAVIVYHITPRMYQWWEKESPAIRGI